ncbi:hypothetical protein Emag_001046 [Eimeria magna]
MAEGRISGIHKEPELFASLSAAINRNQAKRSKLEAQRDSVARRSRSVSSPSRAPAEPHRKTLWGVSGFPPSSYINASPASSFPFTGAAKGRQWALRGLPSPRPPLQRGPPPARGMFLLLVYSVAAAAAFLVALCFRRLRPKEGGALRGPRPRFLAGRQYPWGPPQEGVDEDATFLSNALEACLDMETEMGLLPLVSQPVSLNETQAVNNIEWDLKDEAVLFEFEKTAAHKTTQSFFHASQWQTPAADSIYPEPMTGYEANQWSGPHAMMWEEDEGLFSKAPMFSAMPSYEIPRDTVASSQLVPMQQQQHTTSNAAATAANAAQAWQQQLEGPYRQGGSWGAPAPPAPWAPPAPPTPWAPMPFAGNLYGPAVAPDSFSLQQQHFSSSQAEAAAETAAAAQGWPQHHRGPSGAGGPWESTAAPAPSAGDFHGSAASAGSLSSLQQRQDGSSQGAGPAGDSGASSVSTSREQGDSEPPSLKRKRDKEDGKKGSLMHTASKKKHKLSNLSRSSQQVKETIPKKKRQKLTVDLIEATSTRVGKGPSGALSPSTSSESVSRGSPTSSETSTVNGEATSGATTSGESPSVTSQDLQDSGLVVSEGFLTITLLTGEEISFPHPPEPVPVDTPAHYRLPRVPSEAIQTEFQIDEALVGPTNRSPWNHLDIVINLLLQNELNSKEVEAIMLRCQALVRHMMTKCLSDVAHTDPFTVKERLGVRFVILETLVICIQLLGPAMKPHRWFPQLLATVPTEFNMNPRIVTTRALMHFRLSKLLAKGLKILMQGKRPSLQLTTKIKSLLFSPYFAPRNIRKHIRKEWWRDFKFKKPRAEEEEDLDETPSDKGD